MTTVINFFLIWLALAVSLTAILLLFMPLVKFAGRIEKQFGSIAGHVIMIFGATGISAAVVIVIFIVFK